MPSYRVERSFEGRNSGVWKYGFGDVFPGAGDPPHHGSLFTRTDLGKLYKFDQPSQTWIEVGTGGAAVGVQEVDGVPSETALTTLQFDQADGFVQSNLGGGVVRIDLTAVPQANIESMHYRTLTKFGPY